MATVFKNIGATTATFVVAPGIYDLDVHATWGGGSVTLQKQAADDSSWINVGNALSADGLVAQQYLAGTYRLLVATASGIYANIVPLVLY